MKRREVMAGTAAAMAVGWLSPAAANPSAPPTVHPARATTASLARALREGRTNVRDIAQAHLDRIAAIDRSGPRLNSIIEINPDAMREAQRLDGLARKGQWLGPLHGIPYAPKDILATKGIRTTNGSRATAEWVPEYESAVTERLAAAGAILVGKLNLLEFAMGSGQRGLVAPARNPWSLAHSPSGSSSGSGAALARVSMKA